MAEIHSLEAARQKAQDIIDRERFDAEVVAEVQRLREVCTLTPWAQFLNWLPFTITWKKPK